ncbi:MAG: hypothetical protein AB7N71_08205 [Phycisphaerae bacterium]
MDWIQRTFTTGQLLIFLGVMVGLLVVTVLLRRTKEAFRDAKRRSTLRQHAKQQQARTEEVHRLADQIIATSSTETIAGYEIVRQVEAVFVEGCKTPEIAVLEAKAIAARKGGNAVTNLKATRAANGKCAANGDAVIVRSLG